MKSISCERIIPWYPSKPVKNRIFSSLLSSFGNVVI